MTRKKLAPKQKKHKTVGMEAIVEPGVGALYVRGTWMKKMDALGKRKKKLLRQSYRKKI
jgi:hypothetical protein